MLKRLSILASLAVIAAMAFAAMAPVASAEEPSGEMVGGVFLRGAGAIDAEGTGLAAMKGRMDLNVSAEAGILLVKDIAGDADVEVTGHGETTEWLGFDVYFGFDGQASIVGSHVAVIVVGEGIDLHVAGKGWAYLKGRGTVEIRGHGSRPWTEEGTFAGVGAPE